MHKLSTLSASCSAPVFARRSRYKGSSSTKVTPGVAVFADPQIRWVLHRKGLPCFRHRPRKSRQWVALAIQSSKSPQRWHVDHADPIPAEGVIFAASVWSHRAASCDLQRVPFFGRLAKRHVFFLPFHEKKRRLPEKLPFHKIPVQPSGKVAVWTGKVQLPFRFGKQPPAMLNLQKCRFAQKLPSRWQTLFLNQTAETCTRREATGMSSL